MENSTRPFSVYLLLLLLGSAALGQQPDHTSEKDLKRQRQRLQAISMVKQAAEESPLWDNKKAAVQVLTDAADLLWDETPNQSAEWLRTAWALIDQVSGSPKNETLKEFFTRSDRGELRTVVLGIARKHDADLAEKLLQQLSQQELQEKKERGAFDDRSARSEQLLQMAQQAVDSNPDVAFALAERSLTDGVSYSLQNIMTSLRKKNVELANRLFDLALARFSSRVPDPSEGQVLAGYLFQAGFTFAANSSGQTMLVVNPSQQNLPAVATSEPQRAKRFLIAAYEVLLSQPVAVDMPEGMQRGEQLLVLGNRLVRPYYTFAPELSQSVQGFLAQLRGRLSLDGEAVAENETTTLPASPGRESTKRLNKEELYEEHIAELENRADKERNATFKKSAYVNAAVATKPEDYQRAKRIAEKIDDDNLRADVVSFVLFRAALFFVEPTIERAIEIAPQISDLSRRAVVKIAIVQRLLLAKSGSTEPGVLRLEQQRAFDLLTDIERDLKKAEPSAKVARILLARTAALAKLDPAQALLALDQTMERINKLDTFDLRDSVAPELGLGVASSGATVVMPRIGFDLRSAIDPLIVSHFEQISGIVERLTPKDVNGVARLEVAKLFLKKSAASAKHSARLVP